jgi:cytochrome c biogenesis protein CcmG, thiol:disulfide interchange protein DsbE
VLCVKEMSEEAASQEPERADGGQGVRTVVLVLVLAAGFAFIPKVMSGLGQPAMSEEAPELAAPVVANALTPDQKHIKLSELRGHPVVLDFWATWCGPCQATSPIVNSIAQRYRDKGLVVLGVNTSDERGLAERYAAKKGLTFPILFDDGNVNAHRYKVENLPTLFVISKEGKIVAVRHGITSDADLDRLVKQVL